MRTQLEVDFLKGVLFNAYMVAKIAEPVKLREFLRRWFFRTPYKGKFNAPGPGFPVSTPFDWSDAKRLSRLVWACK